MDPLGSSVGIAKTPDVVGLQRRQLEALVVDNRELDRLEELIAEFNLFEAIGAMRQELRHSDFLSFLLDPNQNHGLGDFFLKTLFKRCLIGATGQEVSAVDIDVADLSDAVVERERWNIDVLVYSEQSRIVLAIENKIDCFEHSNQLERYREAVEREFAGYKKALIFLTPDGDAPSDPERWLPLSYSTLIDAVRSVREARKSTLGGAIITTLQHYETMVRRHIVSESEIAKLCQQIYKQHRNALDLIFEHIPDLQMNLKAVLEEEVRKQPGFQLDHCTKRFVRFFHEAWDKDPRQKNGMGWTWTKRVVLFEIVNDLDYMRLKLIVGPVAMNDLAGVAFRKAVFECTQKYRTDFRGGSGTLYDKYTTVLSRELVKKAEYAEPGLVPDKARHALGQAFVNDVSKAIERLREVFSS